MFNEVRSIHWIYIFRDKWGHLGSDLLMKRFQQLNLSCLGFLLKLQAINLSQTRLNRCYCKVENHLEQKIDYFPTMLKDKAIVV